MPLALAVGVHRKRVDIEIGYARNGFVLVVSEVLFENCTIRLAGQRLVYVSKRRIVVKGEGDEPGEFRVLLAG